MREHADLAAKVYLMREQAAEHLHAHRPGFGPGLPAQRPSMLLCRLSARSSEWGSVSVGLDAGPFSRYRGWLFRRKLAIGGDTLTIVS